MDLKACKVNIFMTTNTCFSYHTKVTFCPERAIEKERLEAKRDLKMTVERLAITYGPKSVLHNLSFAKKFAKAFREDHGKFCRYH